MTRQQFMNGCALVQTQRFSFEKVLGEYERIIDAFTHRFGDEGSTVTTRHAGFQEPKEWRRSGKEDARLVWRRIHEHYDVVGESLVHSIGPLVVKAYLLGKTWCVYHPSEDMLCTPLGEPIGRLDPAPVICIHGSEHPRGYALLSERLLREVLATAGTAANAPLSFLVQAVRDAQGIIQGFAGSISLPYAHYGDGVGAALVRCVLPDGGEVSTISPLQH